MPRSVLRFVPLVGLSLLCAGLAVACNSGELDPASRGTGAGAGPIGPGAGAGAGGADTSGGAGGPGALGDSLPARIRRLTNAEYDATVRVLLGVTDPPSIKFSFPPDTKQGPRNSPAGPAFTVNDAQRVDPVMAGKLDAAALAIVEQARGAGRLEALAPCADASMAEACAKSFIASFGAKAYRRPLSTDESAGLLKAYHLGADGYTYAEGIDLVARVLLQSPGLLYTTEIGAEGAGAAFTMTPDEIATSLSYLLTAEPPDAPLLASAASGSLTMAEGRAAEARRLLTTSAGRARFVRVVREWLGIDDVARREKSQSVYPEFGSLAPAMEQESRAFIEEVLNQSTGTLSELLSADWTIAEPPLAAMYGVPAATNKKRTSLSGVKRRGILNQGAFLSVFANNSGSHPVFRGVAILRRVACIELQDPGALGFVVSFPAVDATKTTRNRFEAHAKDAACGFCHKKIDPLGFAFENYDGMGKERSVENALPVDTRVTVNLGADFDGTYESSAELITALSQSDSVRKCMARQIFHSTVGRSDQSIAGAENAFVETWKQLPLEQQGRLSDVLVAFVQSPGFVQRITP